MTGAQIKTFFENLIDDTIDGDFAYDLMNQAKEEIESERDWEILKKMDNSNSTVVGRDYATGYSLPSDFFRPVKDGVWVGDFIWTPIMQEEQLAYKTNDRRYFIDHLNSKIHLCGVVATSQTLTIFYIYNTSDLTATTSPVWPAKFHKILAFKMAELYEAGIDADDLSFRMSSEMRKRQEILQERMIAWDTQLKLDAMDYSAKRRQIDYSAADDIVY